MLPFGNEAANFISACEAIHLLARGTRSAPGTGHQSFRGMTCWGLEAGLASSLRPPSPLLLTERHGCQCSFGRRREREGHRPSHQRKEPVRLGLNRLTNLVLTNPHIDGRHRGIRVIETPFH
jgi:hypothetical protein